MEGTQFLCFTEQQLEAYTKKVMRSVPPKRITAKGAKKHFGIERGTLAELVKEKKIKARIIEGKRSLYYDYDELDNIQILVDIS